MIDALDARQSIQLIKLAQLRPFFLILGFFLPLSLIITSQLLQKSQTSLISQVKYWLYQIIALVVSILFYFLSGQFFDFDSLSYFIFYGGLAWTSWLIFIIWPWFTAWLQKKPYPAISFGHFLIVLVPQLLITGLMAGILLAGVNIILLATNELLLDGQMNTQIHTYVSSFITQFVAVLFFLNQFVNLQQQAIKPAPVAANKQPLSYKIVNNFAIFLGLPLFFIYNLIFYLYAAQILISQTWPQGLVSWLVLADLALGFLLILLLPPAAEEKPLIKKLNRSLPITLIVPILLMLAAMNLRFQEYGLTAPRFYIYLAAGWALLSCLYLIISKKKYPWVMIAGAGVLLVITAVGPLSATSVSGRNQISRVQNVLIAHQLTTSQISELNQIKLSNDELRVLKTAQNFFGDDDYQDLEPGWLREYWEQSATKELLRTVTTSSSDIQPDYYSFNSRFDQLPITITAGQTLLPGVEFSQYYDSGDMPYKETDRAQLLATQSAFTWQWQSNNELILTITAPSGEPLAKYDFSSAVQPLLNQYEAEYHQVAPAELTFVAENLITDNQNTFSTAKLILNNLSVEWFPADLPRTSINEYQLTRYTGNGLLLMEGTMEIEETLVVPEVRNNLEPQPLMTPGIETPVSPVPTELLLSPAPGIIQAD